MRMKFGNMWEQWGDEHNIVLATTNSYIRSNGELVMGKGSAFEVKNRVPGISKVFGRVINRLCGHLGVYGLVVSEQYGVGGFQTKTDFKYKSDLGLIQHSVNELIQLANGQPKKTFHLAYPGIGYGGLNAEDVREIIEVLPDNVYVWRFKHEGSE